MAQLNTGSVSVTNGSPTVRHTWTVNYSGKVGGPFTAGETLTWGAGGGTGTFGRDDTGGSQLFFVRTSGAIPAAGETITGGTSGTTVVIDSLAAVSSGFDFSASVAAGDTFTIENSGILYHLSSTINVDNFDLTGNYTESSLAEREYAISTDFTPTMGFNDLKVGDLEALSLIGELANQIDTAFVQTVLNEQAITSSGGAATIDFKVGHKAKITLTENVTFTFTAPRGPAQIAVRMIQDATGGRTVTWPAVTWEGGTEPAWNTAANKVNIAFFYYDGATWFGWGRTNF